MEARSRRIATLLLALALALLAGWWFLRGEEPAAALPAAGSAAPPPPAASLQGLPARDLPGVDVFALQRTEARCQQDAHEVTRRRWDALGRSSDRDERIAHALLAATFDGTPGESARLLGELSSATPADADLLWFHAAHCRRSGGCDPRAARERMVAAEPDNLAGWLLVLAEAGGDGGMAADDAAMDALLARAAQSRYYAQRHVDAFLRTYQALAGLPVPASCSTPEAREARRLLGQPGMRGPDGAMGSSEMALVPALATVAAHFPDGGRIGLLCQPSAAMSPGRSRSCRSIAARMAEGETLIDHAIGLGTLVRLSADMPAEDAALWRERYRQHRWLMEPRNTEFAWDARQAYARMTEGEVRTQQAQLQRKGLWPPPAEWLPDDPHARGLILGAPPGR